MSPFDRTGCRRSPWAPQSNGEDEPQHRNHRRDLIEAAAEVERLLKRTSRNWPSNTGRLLGASTICNFGRVARASGSEVNWKTPRVYPFKPAPTSAHGSAA